MSCTCATPSPARARHQRAGDGHARPVGIAIGEAQAGGFDRAALDIEREHRAGQRHAALEHAGDAGAVDALAALDRVEIVHERVEEAHLRMLGQEALEVGSAARVMRVSVFIIFDAERRRGAAAYAACSAGRQTRQTADLGHSAGPCGPRIGSAGTPVRCGLMAALAPGRRRESVKDNRQRPGPSARVKAYG